ncbi:peptidyl-prolyl cis-trans isomerase [Kamptonema cortianum]|jgi:peptidyl-prolyl cis-trans isomerase C|nr:peptidyl-prolyl cis-trans isomerase [Geitlerinema splendidum]MDK3160874.1 peptidyl-prolyl cis-trans isomerase [Kamptonema cortianum]
MKSTLLKSISLVAFLAVSTPTFAADPVVAIVDDQKFTYSEIMKAKEGLPKQYQSAPEDKIFPALVNQAVDTFLINKAAQASGEANNPEVKQAIQKATENIVSQAYLLSQIKGKITDADVKAKYEEVVKQFPQEKEVHIRHILVDDKNVALSVIKALQNGTDFKKLAQSKSKDETAKEGGELGWFRKGELPAELAEAAFALKPGTYSQEPIKTDFGWHVIMLEGVRDAKPPKFDEVKDELKSLMTQEAILALVKDLRSKAKVELFDKNGKPLPKEAEKKSEAATPAPTAPADAAAPTAPAAEAPATTTAPASSVPAPAPAAAPEAK